MKQHARSRTKLIPLEVKAPKPLSNELASKALLIDYLLMNNPDFLLTRPP